MMISIGICDGRHSGLAMQNSFSMRIMMMMMMITMVLRLLMRIYNRVQ